MIIHLYALCWNEEKMLPHFLRHYENMVDTFFIFDNGSDDASIRLLEAHPKVTLNRFKVTGDSFVLDALYFYNNIWKQSRGIADWVILCNVDEHLYHPEWHNLLKKSMKRKITLLPATGYQMISATFPAHDCWIMQHVRYGFRDSQWNKIACFNPMEIEEINFTPGRHEANPAGNVRYPEKTRIKLLHYKYMGLPYIIKRYAELGARLTLKDQEKNFGHQYFDDPADLELEFKKNMARAKPVISGIKQYMLLIKSYFFGRHLPAEINNNH